MFTRSVLFLTAFLAGTALAQQPLPAAPPTPVKGLAYDAEFFPGAKYDPAVPTPDSVLGYRLGDKAAKHAEVEAVIKAIAAKAPTRVKLFEYATSHEGRKLYYLAISSPSNIAKLDSIKADAAKLADPRLLSKAQHEQLAASIPAIAWLAYVIHGNEMSGTDAALAAIYHLAAGTDDSVTSLLNDTVVLIDPLMNPDGRDRCIIQITQQRTAQPAVDDQSIIHAETWPGGRTNHYLCDMNRDWIWATQPESRGRIKAAGDWNPHYFVESHEQGPQESFLFMPPRAPVNPNIPQNVSKWSAIFGDDQGKAFDRFGWRYFTGEWNEEWYPGYSGSWAALRGSIDNLYEQARIITDGVRRQEGTIEPYREAVHKQLVSTMANLATLQKHRTEIIKDFAADRWRMVSDNSPYAKRMFVLAGSFGNIGRWGRLMDILKIQGIEAYQLTAELKATGRDWLGREVKDQAFPPGTVVVPGRQPQGRLAAAMLELDPRMSPEFLTEERRELLRFGQSRLYDTTAWNAAMLYGIDAYEIDAALPKESRVAATQTEGGPPAPANLVAWAFDGRDDRSVSVAARLMDQGVHVRALNKPTVLGATFARGSIFVMRKDNQDFKGDLAAVVAATGTQFALSPTYVTTSMGPGELPDTGGQHFVLLEQPRIAVLTRDPFNAYTVGECWHLIDHEMGIRAAFLNTAELGGMDLRRYNVLVIPDGSPDGWADKIPAIKSWVDAGGTLIAIGSSAAPFTKDKDGIGTTRNLPDVLLKLDDFRAAIVRDWLGKTAAAMPDQVWSFNPPEKLEYPWTLGEPDKIEEPEAKRRDQWRSLFMPTGAILAARTDDRHWITAGCGEVLPVIYTSGPVLLPTQGGNAPVLMGAIVPSTKPPEAKKEEKKDDAKKAEDKKSDDKSDKDDKKKDDKKDEPKPGWLLAPPGFELRLRMSGLLWPEAADRIAHSAYCTQEHIGSGQIILFANSPTFRGCARGSTRLFMNAVVCGPGMGASHPIKP